jgi:hypothetical protein
MLDAIVQISAVIFSPDNSFYYEFMVSPAKRQ